ncbi:MAG: DUF4267 domain-containing protein [Polyangiaceae bacterium]|nr:DUF4267 domain-containing protein [Polyangiaceae bacterium]
MNNASTESVTTRSSFLAGRNVLVAIAGAMLVLIGARFLLVPEAAAEAFGVPMTDLTAYPQAKGIRDLVFGVLLGTFFLMRERRAAAVLMLVGSVIAVADGFIVLAARGVQPGFLAIHWGTAIVCALAGALDLRSRTAPAVTSYSVSP